MKGTIKFIDLFAGIGGIRCGLELAAHEAGYKTECVFTSEIKKHAIKVLKQNHPNELINGDITQVNEKEIPDFDICCAGFPCQSTDNKAVEERIQPGADCRQEPLGGNCDGISRNDISLDLGG